MVNKYIMKTIDITLLNDLDPTIAFVLQNYEDRINDIDSNVKELRDEHKIFIDNNNYIKKKIESLQRQVAELYRTLKIQSDKED